MPVAAASSLRAYLLALGLGAVSVFGFAPFYLFPLPILTLASLLHLARDAAPGRGFGLGYAHGLGWYLSGVSWVYVSMHTIGGMPPPVALLAVLAFAAYLALFPALALGLALRLPLGQRARWLLALPALWVMADWLRGWLFTGFPWQAVGYAQAPTSPLAGYAPVLGLHGVSAAAVFTAAALMLRRPLPWALAAAVWLGGWGLAHVPWTRPVGEPVTVSLLQGNIPQALKFEPERLADTLACPGKPRAAHRPAGDGAAHLPGHRPAGLPGGTCRPCPRPWRRPAPGRARAGGRPLLQQRRVLGEQPLSDLP